MRLYSPLLFICLLLALEGRAQNCGRTDTVTYAPQVMGEYQIDINDFVNNDLADPAQGVCGVEITFAHQHVYDVTIELVSPGGQVVQLVGPINGQPRPSTFFTRWFIDFTTCGDTPNPDPGFPAQWDNLSPFNWLAGATYTGTYHPASGCLEDFNIGPVNGSWTLRINSSRPGAGGAIAFARIIFCDETGLDCCFAEAGTIDAPNLVRCEGHPDLDLDPVPFYTVPRPDSVAYGYTYLAFQTGGALAQIDSLADWTDLAPGSYEMCGLSYLLADSSMVTSIDESTSRNDLQSNLGSLFPLFCGDLSTECQTFEVVATPDTTFIDRTICTGDQTILAGQIFDSTATYNIDLVGRGLCDSIVQLRLEVVDELFGSLDTTLCALETVAIGSSVYNTSGIFVDTIPSSFGCDSIVTLSLTVRDQIVTDTSVVLCAGDTVMIGNEVFSATQSNIVRTLTSTSTGCDSTIFMDLVVLDPQIVIAPFSDIDCNNETMLLNAGGSVFSQLPIFTWSDTTGTVLSMDPSLTVVQAGVYILELEERLDGLSCVDRDTFTIQDLRDPPTVAIELPDTLTCQRLRVQLGSSSTSQGSEFEYSWTGMPASGFIGPTDRAFSLVEAPGTYKLVVSNSLTGCLDSAEVVVFQDTLSPDANIVGVGTLNCFAPTRTLMVDSTQADANLLTYNWAIDCQGIFDSPSVIADCPAIYALTVTNSRTGCTATSQVDIASDFTAPIASMTPAEVLNCYMPEQWLDASSSTSLHGLNFTWTSAPVGAGPPLGVNDSLLITEGGNYQVLVQDSINGCVDSAQVFVPVDQVFPNADAGADTTVLNCYQPTATIGGLGSSSGPDIDYAWVAFGNTSDTLGQSASLFVEAPGGAFILSVLDVSNGCETLDTARVLNQIDTPFIRLEPPLAFGCFTDSVLLDAGATNLGFNYQLSWTGPCVPSNSDTTLVSVFCPGNYELEILNTDNGCPAVRQVEVELAPNALVAVLPDEVVLDCTTGQAIIDNSLSTPASRTEWLRDGQAISLLPNNPTVTVPGLYTYIISNLDGSCSDTATVQVTVDCPILPILVPPDSLTCDRGQVILDASFSLPAAGPGVSVEWLFSNPICVQPQADPRQLGVACPGTYGFVIVNGGLGLRDTIFVEVTQDVRPPVVEAGLPDTLTCLNPQVILDAAGGELDPRYDYDWTQGIDTIGSGQTTIVTEPGVYLLQVRNRETGCRAADAVAIFQDIDVPDLEFSNNLIPCREDSFAIAVETNPNGNYSFDWNGPTIQAGDNSDTLIAGGAGNYIATVVNLENGCPTSASVDLIQLPCPPCLQLEDSVLTCTNETIELALDFCEPCQGCTFVWSFNGNEVAGETDASLTVSEAGTYSVRVVNQFQLAATATVEVADLRVLPAAAAGPDRFLTCDSSAVWLGSDDRDSIFGFEFQWLDAAGAPLPNGDSNYVRVGIEGLYQLQVTNPISDCIGFDTVLLAYDTLPPTVEAGPDRVLTCDDPLRVLDGIGSSTGSAFAYTWTGGPSITCLEGIETLSPIVACGGVYYLEVLDRRNGCRSLDSVIVIADDDLPEIIPMADTNLTCANPSLDLLPIILDAGLLPSWCPLDGFGQPIEAACQDVSTLTTSDAGDYRFELFNAATGCRNGFNLTLGTDFAAPTVEAGLSDTLFCTLDSLALVGGGTANSGLEPLFQWSSDQGFPIGDDDQALAYAFAPDRYFLTVTDPRNGCTEMDSVDLFRDREAPEAFAGSDSSLTCALREIRLMGDGTSLSGQLSFAWTTPDGLVLADSNSLTPLVGEGGTYVLAVTDRVNGCTAFDVLEVNENLIAPSAAILSVDTLLINCYQPSLAIDATASASNQGADIDFNWRTIGLGTPLNGQMGTSVQIDQAGTYRLIIQDRDNGCRDTLDFSVASNFAQPGLTILEPEIITCSRPEVVLSTSAGLDQPYTYLWQVPMGDTLNLGPTAIVGQAASYMLIATDTISGCSRNFFVAVDDDLEAPLVQLSNPPVLGCDRVLSPISGAGSSQGGEFVPSWSGGLGTAFLDREDPYAIAAEEPGIYYLEVLNTRNGCSTTDSTRVNLVARAITSLDYELEEAACAEDLFGGLMVIGQEGGTPPFRYRLDGGLLTDRLVYGNLPIGEHTLTVVDSSGCDFSQTFSLLPGTEIGLELGPDTIIRQGDSLLLDFETSALSVETFIWTTEGPVPTPGQAPMWVRPERDYVYQLTVVDTNGCQASDIIRIGVVNDLSLFMPSAFSPNGDSQNDLYFPFAGPQVERVLTFRIYDRWGNLTHEQLDIPANDPRYGWDGTLDGRTMNPAVFIWQVELLLVDGTTVWRHGDLTLVR